MDRPFPFVSTDLSPFPFWNPPFCPPIFPRALSSAIFFVMAHRKSASAAQVSGPQGHRNRTSATATPADMDFAANPQPISFQSREEFAAAVRTEFQSALEDDDFVAHLAVALAPHFPGSAKRPRGRPSLTKAGDDHDESESIVAQAKVHVLDKMENCTVWV